MFTKLRIAGAGLLSVITVACLAVVVPASALVAHAQVSPLTCFNITDNGTDGLEILGHGAGSDVTMNGNGNCFTATDKTYVTHFGIYAYEYVNGDGNCLYVSGNGTGYVTLASGCSSGDGYELLAKTGTTDTSGQSGVSLDCTAGSCDFGSNNQICAVNGNSGADVNVEDNFDGGNNLDRCTWTTSVVQP